VEVIRGHERAPAWPTGAVIAIGNFDGVHIGHRALIAKARALAQAQGARTVALTFDPHPSALFGKPPAQISSLARRVELLADAGADAVVVEAFTRELAARTPHAFVEQILLQSLNARAVVVGYDFCYGAGRAGTIETLRAQCGAAGVEVAVVAAVESTGEVASSTRIRQHLRDGQLDIANRLLGRRWDIDGIVVHGAKRGRAIGIPTANIRPESDLVVSPGIYAVTFSVDDGPALPAVASLGTNPTFVEQGGLVLEVHVLDGGGDYYDKRTRTAFAAYLRPEAKFESVETLLTQIRLDIDAARRVLAAAS
jgi:riboflavin kinase / FMN adenylyltransferase